MDAEQAAGVFAEQRTYLLGVAYRLTGSWADAEDVVADAWPRWAEHAGEVRDPRAWLIRVVGRMSLDHLRSARVRRETYIGPWLPEPLVTAVSVGAGGPGGTPGRVSDPLDLLVRDESVRMAFLVVLDELTPEQRLAVVLHDVIGLDFTDVAEVIGCSVATARQHASRGRRRLTDANPAPRPAADLAWELLGQLSDALTAGDVNRLTGLLAPDIVLISDGAGAVMAARRPLVGAVEVARFLHGLAAKYGEGARIEPVLVNGDPGFVVRTADARPQVPKIGVYSFAVREGALTAAYAVLAPDKLGHLPS